MRRKNNWNSQIVTIENKGRQAFLDGIPEKDNPYLTGYNKGGGLQRQRRDAWWRGYCQARAEK